jgi:glycosyltransferase involved in cell wall biosynthesis
MTTNRMKVLCLADYYLPGYKGGGPIRTIANMCDALSSHVEFWIFTRDRDLCSDVPYTGIQVNSWNIINNTHVYYASPYLFNSTGLIKAIEAREFDFIYLNGFFSYSASISMYLNWKFGKIPALYALIAPRGEFSKGALAFKRFKKRVFLAVSRLLGFYKDVYWHASTEVEAADILEVFPGVGDKIHTAPDLVTIGDDIFSECTEDIKRENEFQIVFISRISPKKNLDGLLEILSGVNCAVKLDIFGPVEDQNYWRHCQTIGNSLPKNITITYCGTLKPDEVSNIFSNYDLFVFPTHGENFGHVIFESLRVGTPVLVSDQTPWQHQSSGAITVLPLESTDAWISAIETAAGRKPDQRRKMRLAAVQYAKCYMAATDSLSANLKMFREVASKGF